jgi:hypothetical protein
MMMIVICNGYKLAERDPREFGFCNMGSKEEVLA